MTIASADEYFGNAIAPAFMLALTVQWWLHPSRPEINRAWNNARSIGHTRSHNGLLEMIALVTMFPFRWLHEFFMIENYYASSKFYYKHRKNIKSASADTDDIPPLAFAMFDLCKKVLRAVITANMILAERIFDSASDKHRVSYVLALFFLADWAIDCAWINIWFGTYNMDLLQSSTIVRFAKRSHMAYWFSAGWTWFTLTATTLDFYFFIHSPLNLATPLPLFIHGMKVVRNLVYALFTIDMGFKLFFAMNYTMAIWSNFRYSEHVSPEVIKEFLRAEKEKRAKGAEEGIDLEDTSTLGENF